MVLPTDGSALGRPGPTATSAAPARDENSPVRLPIYPGPLRSNWVPRPRLQGVLGDAAREGRTVVVVSAPAGAGKSVLARQWLEVDTREHLEIALTPDLDEGALLLHTVVGALETVGVSAPNLQASITSTEPRLSTVVIPALERLLATRTRPFVLVLDDVHVLQDRSCHDILLALCNAAPTGSQVILLSRESAPAWLARARAEGRLVDVTGDDLRFTAEEAAELHRRMAVPATGPDTTKLLDRTEGWAVALYLTGLAQQHDRDGRPERTTTRAPGAHRFVADYVSTEVLRPLDADLQWFLTRTSVLDELSPDLCDAVLGRDDSAALLARLREQLQLVIPLDADGHRFRYHHLLADALRAELVASAPAEVPVLHSRASQWYAAQGDLDAAIRQAKAAGDLALVGRLVWSRTAHCVGSGEKDRLAFWLRDLSEQQLSGDRWLSLATAWLALQSAQTDRMDRYILRCETHAGPGWRQRADQDQYAASLAVIVALGGRTTLAESEALTAAAGRGLPAEDGFRPPALFLRGVALTLGRDMDRGRECLVEAGRLGRVLDVPTMEADALSWRGVLAMAEGDHRAAQGFINSAADLIREHRLERLATAAHSITAQALVLALRHDARAATTLAVARRLTLEFSDLAPWFSVCGRLIQARAAIALGEGPTARQLIAEAEARMTPDLEDSVAADLLRDSLQALTRLTLDGVTSPALSAAETRVLQFLPSHLQLSQIGEHLFISTNTVKTHVRAIHHKLGVTSRAEVVARAQELGLLEAPVYD